MSLTAITSVESGAMGFCQSMCDQCDWRRKITLRCRDTVMVDGRGFFRTRDRTRIEDALKDAFVRVSVHKIPVLCIQLYIRLNFVHMVVMLLPTELVPCTVFIQGLHVGYRMWRLRECYLECYLE